MEGRLWTIVLSLLPPAAKELGRYMYDTRTILMVGLWAILHDRPACWACDAKNWSGCRHPKKLPDPSTVSRRWRAERLQAEANEVQRRALAQLSDPGSYAAMDGRSLPVARHSKDPEARSGRGTGGMAKGYKLHAVVNTEGAFSAFVVESLNVGEAKVARTLLRRLPAKVKRLVADTNYDSMPLRRAAQRVGCRLYTPLRNGRVGRRRQPERVHMWRLLRRRVGQRLLKWRNHVDRCFGQLSNFSCGYKGLPNWCRGLARVRRWLWGKVLFYHAFLLVKRRFA